MEELKIADYNNRWESVSTILDGYNENLASEVPIGAINVKYNIIDKEAINDNLLDIQVSNGDSLLVDVPNRSRSPYLTRSVVFASPLKSTTNTLNPNFYLDFNRYSNSNNISKIEINFNLGEGWKNLNSILSPQFPNYGIYYIDFKITLQNGNVKYNTAKFEIVNESNIKSLNKSLQQYSTGDCEVQQGEFYSAIPFQGYDENKTYYAKGEYDIRQGGDEIDSLIVVLDGFDPEEGTPSGNNLDDIYDDFNQFNLAASLQADYGFDIVPLNFKSQVLFENSFLFPKKINGGTDYIERNAMLLITLLERLQECKTGNIPIKVVGFSMGGLIARYALTYMEANNIEHGVDILATIDTPHQGAVVPKGFQDLANFTKNATLGVVKSPLTLLESPAAKQMLKHHILSGSQTPDGAPNFHSKFFADLDQLGNYPQNLRKISVSDGSSDGSNVNNSGEAIADFTGQFGFYNGLGGIETKLKMNYSPNPGTTINDFYFRLRLSFLFTKFTIYKKKYQVSSIPSLGSLENAPAGYYDVDQLSRKFLGGDFYGIFGDVSGTALEEFLRATLFNIDVNLTNPNFTFVPTKSSLDFIGDPYLYENISNRDLVCSGETPFDSYIISNFNREHVDIFFSAANFLEEEFIGNQQPADVSLNGTNDLNGPDYICGANITYYIDACTGSINSWNTSSNLIINSSDSFSINISPSSTQTGEGAYITGYYVGGGSFTKNIFIGKPDIDVSPLDSDAPYWQAWAYINGDSVPLSEQNITNHPTYSVVASSGSYATVMIQGPYNGGNEYKIVGNGNDNYWSKTIDVSIENDCGTIVKRVFLTPPPEQPCNYSLEPTGMNTYALLPPPDPCGSNSTLKTSASITSQKSNGTGEDYNVENLFNIKVYDLQGVLKLETDMQEINITQLRKGIYIIKGTWNGNVYTKKIKKK